MYPPGIDAAESFQIGCHIHLISVGKNMDVSQNKQNIAEAEQLKRKTTSWGWAVPGLGYFKLATTYCEQAMTNLWTRHEKVMKKNKQFMNNFWTSHEQIISDLQVMEK